MYDRIAGTRLCDVRGSGSGGSGDRRAGCGGGGGGDARQARACGRGAGGAGAAHAAAGLRGGTAGRARPARATPQPASRALPAQPAAGLLALLFPLRPRLRRLALLPAVRPRLVALLPTRLRLRLPRRSTFATPCFPLPGSAQPAAVLTVFAAAGAWRARPHHRQDLRRPLRLQRPRQTEFRTLSC